MFCVHADMDRVKTHYMTEFLNNSGFKASYEYTEGKGLWCVYIDLPKVHDNLLRVIERTAKDYAYSFSAGFQSALVYMNLKSKGNAPTGIKV